PGAVGERAARRATIAIKRLTIGQYDSGRLKSWSGVWPTKEQLATVAGSRIGRSSLPKILVHHQFMIAWWHSQIFRFNGLLSYAEAYVRCNAQRIGNWASRS
ncbi:unnamed protein product, partial [Ectocarpus sp. 4 AP-2014]